MFRYYTIAFGVGAAVMAAEMSSGRLLAPFFGTSTPVWAMVIGTVLGSLAVGNYLGGRWYPLLVHRLYAMLLAGGASLVVLLVLAHAVLSRSLSLIHHLNVGVLAGASLAVMVLLAAPMVLLGLFHPVLVNLAASDGGADGRSVGKMTALSTIGSLLGTWLGGIVMVPLLGPRATLGVWASVLILLALLVVRKRSAQLVVAVCGFVLVATSLLLWTSPTKTHPHAVFVGESTYNHLEVVERRGQRRLFLNEGYAMQSVYRLDGRLPLHNVWAWYGAAPAWTRTGKVRSVLLLGLGGGTSALILRRWYPRAHIVGVELDPKVVEVGRALMGMPKDIDVAVGDARSWLRTHDDTFDVIIVDAFRFPYVPFHLTTQEFMRELNKHLNAGGAVTLNIGRDGTDKTVVNAVGTTLRAVLPNVYAADLSNKSNTILVGMRHDLSSACGLAALPVSVAERQELRLAVKKLRPFHATGPAPVLTDERAPVEWLTDSILWRHLWRHRS